MDIEWKEYNNTGYFVSNHGDIKSPCGRLVGSYGAGRKKYKVVGIKGKRFFAHKLVAELFIPNPDDKPQVDHIDTDVTNNRADNLRWVTPKENMANDNTSNKLKTMWVRYKHPMLGRHHTDEARAKMVKPVILTNTGERFDSISTASKIYNVHDGAIAQNCKGKRKSAGKLNGKKMVWKYAE